MTIGAAFDLEGTSVNLEPQRHTAHLQAAASFQIALDYEFAVAQLPHFIGGPDEAVAAEIFVLGAADRLPPRDEFVREFLRRDTQYFEQSLATTEIQPRDGLIEFLDWLHAKRIPTALGSLTGTRQALVILNRSDLERRFAGSIVLREDVRELKPAPDVFIATAARMGVAPCSQIVFEDSPRGIIAAHRAGSHPIGMPVVQQPAARKALSAVRPLRIFADWRDPELREFVEKLIVSLQQIRASDVDRASVRE